MAKEKMATRTIDKNMESMSLLFVIGISLAKIKAAVRNITTIKAVNGKLLNSFRKTIPAMKKQNNSENTVPYIKENTVGCSSMNPFLPALYVEITINPNTGEKIIIQGLNCISFSFLVSVMIVDAGVLPGTPGAPCKVNRQPVKNSDASHALRTDRMQRVEITTVFFQAFATDPSLARFTYRNVQQSGFKEPPTGRTLIFLSGSFRVFHLWLPSIHVEDIIVKLGTGLTKDFRRGVIFSPGLRNTSIALQGAAPFTIGDGLGTDCAIAEGAGFQY